MDASTGTCMVILSRAVNLSTLAVMVDSRPLGIDIDARFPATAVAAAHWYVEIRYSGAPAAHLIPTGLD